MTIIGVTGGVGTGKSTVAALFGGLGAVVLDADRISHRLMEPGQDVWKKISSRFGARVMTADGRIDRRRLGETAFGSSRRLAQLTGIIHPAVRRQIKARLTQIRRRDPRAVVVLDIPLLIEAKGAYPLDALVVVFSPLAAVTRRLKRHRQWSAKEVKRRQSFQMPLKEKEDQADFVVQNGGGLKSTRRQVLAIWKKLQAREKEE